MENGVSSETPRTKTLRRAGGPDFVNRFRPKLLAEEVEYEDLQEGDFQSLKFATNLPGVPLKKIIRAAKQLGNEVDGASSTNVTPVPAPTTTRPMVTNANTTATTNAGSARAATPKAARPLGVSLDPAPSKRPRLSSSTHSHPYALTNGSAVPSATENGIPPLSTGTSGMPPLDETPNGLPPRAWIASTLERRERLVRLKGGARLSAYQALDATSSSLLVKQLAEELGHELEAAAQKLTLKMIGGLQRNSVNETDLRLVHETCVRGNFHLVLEQLEKDWA